METPEAIPSPAPAQTIANPAMDVPPWPQDASRSRMAQPAQDVPWSVIALTVLTALCVVSGTVRAQTAPPKELLPVVVYTR